MIGRIVSWASSAKEEKENSTTAAVIVKESPVLPQKITKSEEIVPIFIFIDSTKHNIPIPRSCKTPITKNGEISKNKTNIKIIRKRAIRDIRISKLQGFTQTTSSKYRRISNMYKQRFKRKGGKSSMQTYSR